jgi:hypothetical protein
MKGNSYHALGFSTMGNAIPAIETKASNKNKNIFQIIIYFILVWLKNVILSK